VSFIDAIRSEIDKAANRLASSIVRRGMIGTAPSSSYFFQVTGDDDSETFEGVELQQHFGFASRPPAGGECIVVCPGGEGAGGVSIAEQDRAHRPTSLAEGDAALYGAKGAGQAIVLADALGGVTVTSGGALFVLLGGAGAVDFAVKGTTFNAANAIMLGLVSAALTAGAAAFTALAAVPTIAATPAGALCTTAAGACTAGVGGVTAFLAASATWTATKVKVL
jgi:phage gp45-like